MQAINEVSSAIHSLLSRRPNQSQATLSIGPPLLPILCTHNYPHLFLRPSLEILVSLQQGNGLLDLGDLAGYENLRQPLRLPGIDLPTQLAEVDLDGCEVALFYDFGESCGVK